jgi:hypothetical protein
MSHPANRSVKITAVSSSDLLSAPAAVEAATMRAGETVISSTATSEVAITDPVFVSVTPSGSSEAIPLPSSEWYFSGAALKLKRPLAYNATVAWGSAAVHPTFTVPNGCNGVTIQNVAATSVYIRRGLINAFGLPIGKPGDTNSDDVQGIELLAGASFFLQSGQFAAGDAWYVLGSSGSESVIVNFS